MIEQWEEFTAGPSKTRGERLHVSLNYKGQFLLNKKVIDALGDPKAVILYHSKTTGKIAIRAANRIMPQAFPLLDRHQAPRASSRPAPSAATTASK